MDSFRKRLAASSDFLRLVEAVSSPLHVVAGGVWGASGALLACLVREEKKVPVLVVTRDEACTADYLQDIAAFSGEDAFGFPAWDGPLPVDEEPDPETYAARFRTVATLLREPDTPRMIVAPVDALLQGVPPSDVLSSRIISLEVGGVCRMDQLVRHLVANGMERCDAVEAPGEFSVRGGIVDVFPRSWRRPVRVELFGDTIDSLRLFDPGTQLSEQTIDAAEIVDMSGSGFANPSEDGVSLLDYLPDSALVVVVEPTDVAAAAEASLEGTPATPDRRGWSWFTNRTAAFKRLDICAFSPGDGKHEVRFDMKALEPVGKGLTSIYEALDHLCAACEEVVVFCNNEAEQARFGEILAAAPSPPANNLRVMVGRISGSFLAGKQGFACVAHHELFGRYARRRSVKSRPPGRRAESLTELESGDYVVHATAGIGVFRGLKRLKRGKKTCEYLVLEFDEGARLYVPGNRADLVQKYIGVFDREPRLHRIGSPKWGRQKARVQHAVSVLALGLLELYAAREVEEGLPFPPDDDWQREFEAGFIYEETPDQLATLVEIKRDMCSPRPMDRLICGDVGYGKTELAMRAAFKAVTAGKQVAVLVPTTRTNAQQRDVLRRLASGQVDIVIGTHRLLQKDVVFSDPGLVVIDEEQRFGVRHKEYLKSLRTTVDVLTMTATPIPRTLHMALAGIREISALETPPADRHSIRTRVVTFNADLIREAIRREIRRGGQVFFVHNRVHSIDIMAAKVSELVPEVSIAIGHGQLSERELQQRMQDFVAGRYDVLVATTIIESGLDIPNANTIIINRADRFGLADLHQLRGRVGRYKRRAYAYMLLPPHASLSDVARKRLKAIEDHSELGAGFRIAMRDLEIRGAGNILGPEQSGHIATVGYEMYCQLMRNAVKRLRGEPTTEPIATHLDLDVAAYFTDDYVPGYRQRLTLYNKLARARDSKELDALELELVDRFGPIPPPTTNLLRLQRVRHAAERAGITWLALRDGRVVATASDPAQAARVFRRRDVAARVVDDETFHLVWPGGAPEGQALLEFLEETLGCEKSA